MAETLVPSEASVPEAPPQKGTSRGKSATTRWQERLLPLMSGLMVGLSIFFFVVTMIQMAYLHWSILQFSPIDITPAIQDKIQTTNLTFDEQISLRRLEIQARMEAFLIERRYHQASVSLMSSLWLRYLGFITGMILALVGASFVLGKLREPATELSGKTTGGEFSLRSMSPGLILVVLGVILMFATILDRDTVDIIDRQTYLSSEAPSISLPADFPTLSPTQEATLLPPVISTNQP